MFKKDEIYKRSTIHDMYGGSRQSGISPSAKNPYIFIFSGSSGNQYGYKDRWENKNVFSYTGEGQIGDMKFIKGNLALRDHLENNKRVFLFEYIKKAYVEFIDEVTFMDFGFFPTHDKTGKNRMGIKFFFKRIGYSAYEIPNELKFVNEPDSFNYSKPNKTERTGLVTSRVGQGAYRKSLLHRWEYRCAVSGFDKINILIASHIKPWKNATDVERLDVDNGLLLSPDFDALFDKNLISFENSGNIILSSKIEKSNYLKLGITGKEKIKHLSQGNQEYLDTHRLLVS